MDYTSTGIVISMQGNYVRALLEYGPWRERMLCDIPATFWPPSISPHIEQSFRMGWNDDKKQVSIELLPFYFTETMLPNQSVAVQKAQQLLGIYPGDKVLIVIGPNIPPREKVDEFYIKNAGWGELLSVNRLWPLLISMGINVSDIKTQIIDAGSDEDVFNPEHYNDRHVIFLGSIKSNSILREYYWYQWPEICDTYEFPDDDNRDRLLIKEGNKIIESFNYDDNLSKGKITQRNIEVTDYFIVAHMPNPYENSSRYSCILSGGIGTIGTGYGGIVLTAKRSVDILHEHNENTYFHMVGKVDMKGFLNPSNDPVTLSRFNNRPCNDELLLAGALNTPAVWQKETIYLDSDIERDLEFRREVLESQSSSG